MFIIKTLNKDFNGRVANIDFVDGVATVETLSDNDFDWFKSYGHTIEVDGEKPKKAKKLQKMKSM